MKIVFFLSIILWGLLIALLLWIYIKIKDSVDIKELLGPPKESPEDSYKKELKKIKEDIFNLKGRSNEMPFFYNGLVDGIAKGNEELGNGHLIMAEICFRREIIKKPEQPNAWVGLGHAYSALSRYEEALDAIKTAKRLDENEPLFNREGQISIIHAEILEKLGRCEEAADVLKNEVLVLNPEFKKAKNLLEKCEKKIREKENE